MLDYQILVFFGDVLKIQPPYCLLEEGRAIVGVWGLGSMPAGGLERSVISADVGLRVPKGAAWVDSEPWPCHGIRLPDAGWGCVWKMDRENGKCFENGSRKRDVFGNGERKRDESGKAGFLY